MTEMFYQCSNLQYLNTSNFVLNDNTDCMFSSIRKESCKLITKNKYLKNLFNSDESDNSDN